MRFCFGESVNESTPPQPPSFPLHHPPRIAKKERTKLITSGTLSLGQDFEAEKALTSGPQNGDILGTYNLRLDKNDAKF